MEKRVSLDEGLRHAKTLHGRAENRPGNKTRPSFVSIPVDPLWPGLTDEEWEDIQWMLPPPKKKPFFRKRRRGGRPRASDKKAFEALLWALGGGTLERLPARFAARRTACRRLATWFPPALLDRMWHRHCSRMTDEQADDWRAVFAVKKRRPFWQQLMIAAFRVARNDH